MEQLDLIHANKFKTYASEVWMFSRSNLPYGQWFGEESQAAGLVENTDYTVHMDRVNNRLITRHNLTDEAVKSLKNRLTSKSKK